MVLSPQARGKHSGNKEVRRNRPVSKHSFPQFQKIQNFDAKLHRVFKFSRDKSVQKSLTKVFLSTFAIVF